MDYPAFAFSPFPLIITTPHQRPQHPAQNPRLRPRRMKVYDPGNSAHMLTSSFFTTDVDKSREDVILTI